MVIEEFDEVNTLMPQRSQAARLNCHNNKSQNLVHNSQMHLFTPKKMSSSRHFNRSYETNDTTSLDSSTPDQSSHDKRSNPKGIMIISDSMFRNIDPDLFLEEVWLFSYPGITARQLHEHIVNEYLPCENRIRSVLLHVGTNNVSTSRAVENIDDVITEICDCLELFSEMYPQVEIWFSGILPRLDDDNKRALVVNNKLQQLCIATERYNYIDFSGHFLRDKEPIKSYYRYSDGNEDDSVHFNSEGTTFLQELIGGLVTHIMKHESEIDPNLLKNQRDWDNWREKLYGPFENKKRFHITNWVSAGSATRSKRTFSSTKNYKGFVTRDTGSSASFKRGHHSKNNKYNQQDEDYSSKRKRRSNTNGYNMGVTHSTRDNNETFKTPQKHRYNISSYNRRSGASLGYNTGASSNDDTKCIPSRKSYPEEEKNHEIHYYNQSIQERHSRVPTRDFNLIDDEKNRNHAFCYKETTSRDRSASPSVVSLPSDDEISCQEDTFRSTSLLPSRKGR